MRKDHNAWDYSIPLITSLLTANFHASEYVIGSLGHLSYGGNPWREIWKLLDQFSRFTNCSEVVEHSQGYVRSPALYRYPLCHLHWRLAQEHFLNDVQQQAIHHSSDPPSRKGGRLKRGLLSVE